MLLRSSNAKVAVPEKKTVQTRKRKQAEADCLSKTVQSRKRKQAEADCLSPKQKPSFQSLLSDVHSSDSNKQLLATKEFRKLLPDYKVVQKIERGNLVRHFSKFLNGDCKDLQVEAAWLLLDIVCGIGTKVAPSLQIDILLKLLDIPVDDVRQKAVLHLGVIASHFEGRDLVHKHKAVNRLLVKVVIPLKESNTLDKLSMLRTATFTLLRFCRGKARPGMMEEIEVQGNHHFHQPVGRCVVRHLHKVKQALDVLCYLVLHSTDEKVLENVCSVLSCISEIPVTFDEDTCRRLVELLGFQRAISTPAVCTLGNIARDYSQSKLIVELGAVGHLSSLLEDCIKENCIEVEEVCQTIANICDRNCGDTREMQIQAVIDAKLVDTLINLVNTTKDMGIKATAADAISKVICGGTNDQIKSLDWCIEHLCNCLVFSPTIVFASVDALEAILKVGKADEGNENVYAQKIKEVGGLEMLENLQTDSVVPMLMTYFFSL